MSYRRVRFEYYQVVFSKENDGYSRDRLFDLLPWMDKAKKKSLEGRTYNYRQEQARLEDAYWDDELGFYFLHFDRLRDTNIPSKAKINDTVEPLELDDDEFIGEEVSALYDEANHVLMMQRNRYSLGLQGIEEYLNLIWDKDDEKIYLRPITPPNTFELVRKAKEYRKINIRFADIKNPDRDTLIKNFKSPLGKIISSYGQYQGKNAQISITVGNSSDSLNPDTISDTLDDLENNKQYFSKAEIAKRDDDDTKVELIDLFEHKAHDFALFRMEHREALNHFTIAEEMWKIYSANEDCSNRQKDINKYLR